MSVAVRDLTRPLLAWWVGDFDLYAAESAAQALALANALAVDREPYTLDDVSAPHAGELDVLFADKDGNPCTFRMLLLKQAEPGYLAGYEQ